MSTKGGHAEGPLPQPGDAFRGGPFDRAIAALTTYRTAVIVVIAVAAVLGLWMVDAQLYDRYGGGVLGQAILSEAEAWIAAAASIGLWATARHVSHLAASIRDLRLGSPPVVDAPPPVEDLHASEGPQSPSAEERSGSGESSPEPRPPHVGRLALQRRFPTSPEAADREASTSPAALSATTASRDELE